MEYLTPINIVMLKWNVEIDTSRHLDSFLYSPPIYFPHFNTFPIIIITLQKNLNEHNRISNGSDIRLQPGEEKVPRITTEQIVLLSFFIGVFVYNDNQIYRKQAFEGHLQSLPLNVLFLFNSSNIIHQL